MHLLATQGRVEKEEGGEAMNRDLGPKHLFFDCSLPEEEKETKKELIILLKPTVVGENTWRTQIEASRSQMADWLYVE